MLNQFVSVIAGALRSAAAYAEDAPAAPPVAAQSQQGAVGLVLPIALFIVIFYFLMYRPQKKKQQQHEKMISSIGRGDTIITAGGFFGRITEVLEDSYIIELADGLKARILKSSVSTKREGGDDRLRPRKLKKKKRPVASDNPDAIFPRADESDKSLKAMEEGVSAEENEALIEGLSEDSPIDAEAVEKSKDE